MSGKPILHTLARTTRVKESAGCILILTMTRASLALLLAEVGEGGEGHMTSSLGH